MLFCASEFYKNISVKGASGTTRIGKYDPHKTENKVLN